MTNLRMYIRKILIESMQNPKVLFMAGGPGSGKSTALRRMGLIEQLEIINPDDLYEESLKAEGIPLDRNAIFAEYGPVRQAYLEAQESGDTQAMAELEPEYLRLKGILSRNMVLFNKARKDAKERKQRIQSERGNFVVDGTGGNYKEILKQVNQLQDSGYEVAMLFVDVPLEVSIERDAARSKRGGRTLGASTVERSWNSVAKNLEKYEELFGDNFFYFDAREEAFDASVVELQPRVQRFLR